MEGGHVRAAEAAIQQQAPDAALSCTLLPACAAPLPLAPQPASRLP